MGDPPPETWESNGSHTSQAASKTGKSVRELTHKTKSCSQEKERKKKITFALSGRYKINTRWQDLAALCVLCYQLLFLRMLFFEEENLTRHPWRGCEWR